MNKKILIGVVVGVIVLALIIWLVFMQPVSCVDGSGGVYYFEKSNAQFFEDWRKVPLAEYPPIVAKAILRSCPGKTSEYRIYQNGVENIVSEREFYSFLNSKHSECNCIQYIRVGEPSPKGIFDYEFK